jgi:hypothetical protein
VSLAGIGKDSDFSGLGSQAKAIGRPGLKSELRDLGRKMAETNPLWVHRGFMENYGNWGSRSRIAPFPD